MIPNVVLTQLSIPEMRKIFREEIESYFQHQPEQSLIDIDEIGRGAEFASKITGKAVPTIYDLVSKRLIPHSKRGKDLYFSKRELQEWILSGRRRTYSQVREEAESYQADSPVRMRRLMSANGEGRTK
jgi:hypothetical protein